MFNSWSCHTRINPGTFQLNIKTQPQTTIINADKALLIQDKHISITHPTHNSTEESLHPNIIKVALPVSLNQNCHAASEL